MRLLPSGLNARPRYPLNRVNAGVHHVLAGVSSVNQVNEVWLREIIDEGQTGL